MNLATSWRTALRIARREARRHKGRSALVVAMIAAPVLFLSFAAVSYDMFTLTPAERADRTMGTADARISWPTATAIEQDPEGQIWGNTAQGTFVATEKVPSGADLAATLPAGTVIVPVRRGTVTLKTVDGVGQPNAISVDANHPLATGYVTTVNGRVPVGPDEVALTEQAMRRLGTGVGGTVSTASGTRTYRVVGEVEFPSLLAEVVLFPPIAGTTPAWLSLDEQWLVDTPAPVDWAMVRTLNRSGLLVTSRAVLFDPPPLEQTPFYSSNGADPRQLAGGVLVGGLALLEIILLAGPAFAVSARRRQRQLALVAANGGTPAHIRRMVLADGVVLGLIGAVVGIVAGIALALLARPYAEDLVAHSRAGGYRVFPLALAVIAVLAVVTGVLAALVPAFITARQNVVASLAGRRGVTRSRKRWLVLGIIMVGAGTGIVIYGTQQITAEIMLAGLVLGELGLVLCTPTLVGFIARIGRILPLAPRIALRDAARNRAAAAPAISAVMAAVAGSVALGLYVDSSLAQQRLSWHADLPVGSAFVYTADQGRSKPADPARDPSATSVGAEAGAAQAAANAVRAEAAARTTFAVSAVHEIRIAGCDPTAGKLHLCELIPVMNPDAVCPWITVVQDQQRELTPAQARQANADARCRDAFNGGIGSMFGGMTVDDGTALPALTGASAEDVAAATAVLRAGGVVVTDARYVRDGTVTLAVLDLELSNQPAVDPVKTAPRKTFPGYALSTATAQTGAVISPAALAQTPLVPRGAGILITNSHEPTTPEADRFSQQMTGFELGFWIQSGPQYDRDPRIWIFMVASALITLAAAAIGTGLAAADSRPDLSTLASVGASPRMRRGLSLSQSGVIAGLGSVLGSMAGLGAAYAVLLALNLRYVEIWPGRGPDPMPLVVPWLSLGAALLVVPALAMLGAGLLTRSRLTIERRT